MRIQDDTRFRRDFAEISRAVEKAVTCPKLRKTICEIYKNKCTFYKNLGHENFGVKIHSRF